MRIISKILYGIFVLLLLAVAGLFLVSMLPIPNTVEIKIVRSGSMSPAIPVGSIVVDRAASTYAIGDVITFGPDSKSQIPTTHRIISIEEKDGQTQYVVKGDANDDPDPSPVQKIEVIGKVILSVPYAGYVLDFARQPLGFALMIAVPAGTIIIDELLKIVREVADMRRKKRMNAV